jgi:antitoxin component YwqK of YwqJK toxin-antitoxin module
MHPRILKKIVILFLLLISSFGYSQKNNRYKHKERQGLWVTYTDSSNTQISDIGRYRKGIPKGVWKYYDNNKTLLKKESYRFKKTKISLYYPNGVIKKQGQAKIILEKKLLHFFYYGNWLLYDSTGTLTSKQVYKNGNKISEFFYNQQTGMNDSVVKALNEIDKEFYTYADSIQLEKNTFGENSFEYQRVVALNTLSKTKALKKLDVLLLKYGYLGKTLVGKDYNLAFSMISSSSDKYKEKHYNLIVNATNKGELDLSDVCFYIDKVKVARKVKQIYCTQYQYDSKTNTIFYFPVEDIEHLNERRKKAGLGEVEVSSLNFIKE